jgi:UDP-N-acetylglucosamine acyltransferase
MANNIHPTAIIGDNVEIGDNNIIGAYCIIGTMAEHRKCKHLGKVKIGNGNTITGLVTIDAGTEFATTIGDNCYIMKHAHIGHDAIIGNDVTISCGAKVGGHSILEDKVNLGLNAVIHQKITVPKRCMIGASAFVGKKSQLRAGYKYAGVPVKELGLN